MDDATEQTLSPAARGIQIETPRLGSYFLRGNESREHLELLTEQVERETFIAAERAARSFGIADYQWELLDRLTIQTIRHTEAGEARKLQRGDGWHGLNKLDDLLTAVCNLSPDSDDADDLLTEIDDLIDEAQSAAEQDRCRNTRQAEEQALELETSTLRGLLKAYINLVELRDDARDGRLSEDRALAAAGVVMFRAPRSVRKETV